jgi:hypothetical protein
MVNPLDNMNFLEGITISFPTLATVSINFGAVLVIVVFEIGFAVGAFAV